MMTKMLTSGLADCYAQRLIYDFNSFRAPADDLVDLYAEDIMRKVEILSRSGAVNTENSYALAFYNTMIKPYILRGKVPGDVSKKVFRVEGGQLECILDSMAGGGVTLRMYVRLLQSRPGEAQIDTRIGYGVLEFLRGWSIKTRVASLIGLDFKVEIIDETEAFEGGHLLGFTEKSIEDSHEAVSVYLRSVRAEGLVSVSRFNIHSRYYRGPDADSEALALYKALKQEGVDRSMQAISRGVRNIYTCRVAVIHKLMFGRGFSSIISDENLQYIRSCDVKSVKTAAEISESFFAALAMRPHQDPFDDASGSRYILRGGITKSDERLSISGYDRLHRGLLITPGYGLPLYRDGRTFLGMVRYSEVQNDGYKKIYNHCGKVTGLVAD